MVVKELTRFYQAIREDNRITTSHISLYMALFELWNQNNFRGAVDISRRGVMEAAKINGLATFHKCIKDLCELGYIQYRPSRNPAVPSQVEFTELGTE